MALLCWKWLTNFVKRLNYVGEDVYMVEMAKVYEKRPKYVGNDVDVWEKWLRYVRNGLSI